MRRHDFGTQAAPSTGLLLWLLWFYQVIVGEGLNNEQARNICSICVRNIPARLSLRATGLPDCRVRDNCFMSMLKQPLLLDSCPPIHFEKTSALSGGPLPLAALHNLLQK